MTSPFFVRCSSMVEPATASKYLIRSKCSNILRLSGSGFDVATNSRSPASFSRARQSPMPS